MRVLVTGASGFLGQAICAQLIAQGHTVRGFGRNAHPALHAMGVDQRTGDLSDLSAVMDASEEADAVIHAASMLSIWAPIEALYDTNVRGTDHVLAACELNGVRRLIYTSSTAVVHAGKDLEGVDETTPYARRFSSAYAQTKAMAEQRVLEANGSEIATVALRPHFIWGPGDVNLMPRVVARARAGRLRLVGDGHQRVDTVYVDNAASAHVLALKKLSIGSPIAGKAYFISQGEPVTHEHLINAWLLASGLPPETRHISPRLARALGVVLETIYRTVGASREPAITRFIAEQMSTSHWFNIDAARRELGYVPLVSITEGLHRLSMHLRNEREHVAGAGLGEDTATTA